MAENRKFVKSSDFSAQRDCTGLRKSARFPLRAGPAAFEISNSRNDRIFIAVSPAY